LTRSCIRWFAEVPRNLRGVVPIESNASRGL
jgi:hypothetical protein